MENQEEMLKGMRIFKKSHIWIAQHAEELKKQYPDEFVVVLGDRIVDHGKDARQLKGKLKEKYPRDVKNMAIQFIAEEEPELLL